MHTHSILVTTIACLSAFAAAEPDRPKFYFPRQVKRQIFNNLTGPLTTPARSLTLSVSKQGSSTTKRQTADPLSGPDGVFPPDSAAGTGDAPSSTPSVTTIVIESTTVVIQSDQIAPTDTTDTPSTDDTSAAAAATTTAPTDTPITFGPSGVITPASAAATTSASPDVVDSSSADFPTTDSPATVAAASNAADTDPPTTDTPTTVAVATNAPDTDPTSTDSPDTDSATTDSQTDTAAATTTAPPSAATSAVSLDSVVSNAVSDISSLVSSIVDPPTQSSAPTTTDTPPDSSAPTTTEDVSSSAPTTTDVAVGPDTSAPPPSTINVITSIVSQISNVASSILPSSTPVTTDSNPDPPTTSVVVSSTESATTQPPPPPPPQSSDSVSGSDTVVITSTPPPNTSGISFSALPSGGTNTAPVVTTTPVTEPASSQSGPSGILVGTTASVSNSGILPPTTAGSQAVLTGITSAPTASVGGNTLSTGVASASGNLPASSASTTEAAPVTSILPIGTASGTTGAWLPASIVVQSSPIASDAIATTATGIASTLPQAISPPTGIPQVPEDSTLIQVGFNYSLNYAFVVANSNSSAQIFMYLPMGLAFGLSIKQELVTMNSLNPYDTQNTLGFITTLATAYIPTNMVTTLQQSLHQALSALYQDPDPSVNQLMQYINPAIPLIPGGAILGGSAVVTGTVPSSSASATPGGGGVFNTDSQNSSSATKSTTAVIAVSAISAAAAYGAAMFFIARRYKKRRSLHRRSSSIVNPGQMRYTGSPALMGGAVMSGGRGTPGLQNGRESRGSGRSAGNSARTVEISAPMMAENSLGWN